MNADKMNLRDIKKMRLNRHWSQEQLAEMSGLSIRTIQRIENGNNAGLESLKSLAAVFETEIVDSDGKMEMEQTRKEEAYIQNVKRFFGLVVAVVMLLLVPFIYVVQDSSNWGIFALFSAPCLLAIIVFGHQAFGWFGDEWIRKVINKKLKKKSIS